MPALHSRKVTITIEFKTHSSDTLGTLIDRSISSQEVAAQELCRLPAGFQGYRIVKVTSEEQ